jgi:hypothetical protein
MTKQPRPIPPGMERPPGLPTSPPPPRVKERPILFSGPMVRAILDGRKTQTRRIIKGLLSVGAVFSPREMIEKPGMWLYNGRVFPCPYGKPGDRLWVRESFSTDIRDPLNCVIYKATQEYGKYRDTGEIVRSSFPDGSLPTREEAARGMLPKFWKGKPSIHMPRWASRITLEITGVRVERLQDISNEDCVAEGITAIGKGVRMPDGRYAQAGRYETKASTVRQLYSELWESINGPGSWGVNPWVWVFEFRRCE